MKIIKAALTGAVDTLLVNKNHEHLWGKYDPDNLPIIRIMDLTAWWTKSQPELSNTKARFT
jgi:hypothetical protein